MKLTELEKKMILNVVLNDYQPTNGAAPVSRGDLGAVWANCLNCGPERVESTSIPGVVSSLAKKGVLICDGRGDDATIVLTEIGWHEYQNIRLSTGEG